jgi:hypothetical protein
MSDLNDLIHTNATIAFNQGAQREQERIVKLLQDAIAQNGKDSWLDVIELIKGEQK